MHYESLTFRCSYISDRIVASSSPKTFIASFHHTVVFICSTLLHQNTASNFTISRIIFSLKTSCIILLRFAYLICQTSNLSDQLILILKHCDKERFESFQSSLGEELVVPLATLLLEKRDIMVVFLERKHLLFHLNIQTYHLSLPIYLPTVNLESIVIGFEKQEVGLMACALPGVWFIKCNPVRLLLFQGNSKATNYNYCSSDISVQTINFRQQCCKITN